MMQVDQHTLVLVKPETFHSCRVGAAMQFLESLPNIAIIYMRLVTAPSTECVERHLDHLRPYPFYEKLVTHYCDGPVSVVVCAGPDAVSRVRRAVDSSKHSLHASDSIGTAASEIENWIFS
jgi:nucleoside diphosphate kinase